MQYRVNPKNGDKLSALAFGCMRLPHAEDEARELVFSAIDSGVNYFDTAYIYPGNEMLVGRILASRPGIRDKIYLATKLPPYLVKKPADFTRLLETQLQRLQTDRIDYYLIHMLMQKKEWERLVDLGVTDWIAAEKKKGRIGNIGFSSHAATDTFIELCDSYPWEFCMIQYNYADRQNQAGERGYRHALSLGLPVMVMEPLRGGSLAGKLPPQAAELLRSSSRSPAEWSFRWLWNEEGVTTVLSGMNNMTVLEENLKTAESALPGHLSEAELSVLDEAQEILLQTGRVPCTACGYCMPCPQGVNIPVCFEQYNQAKPGVRDLVTYIIRTHGGGAGLCTACGKCERHCPQSIPIREKLSALQKEKERGLYRPLRFTITKFMKM